MSNETTQTPAHPTDDELCGFMELTPQWWTRLKNAARDRNRLERALRKIVAGKGTMAEGFAAEIARAALGGDRDG